MYIYIGSDELDHDGAATMIQCAMTHRYLGKNIVFQRALLLQRIQLELQLMRGLRLLVWCFAVSIKISLTLKVL